MSWLALQHLLLLLEETIPDRVRLPKGSEGAVKIAPGKALNPEIIPGQSHLSVVTAKGRFFEADRLAKVGHGVIGLARQNC